MKLEQLKETRKRVELTPSSLPSCCMYTLFNAANRVTCMTLSNDTTLLAAGFAESYIRIWRLDGKALQVMRPASMLNEAGLHEGSKLEDYLEDSGENSKSLIGHAGPVYCTCFSPDLSHLVSASGDGTVRLWNLFTFTNVVCYKGHMNPVWSVAFSPLGYYFATASHDKTARLWSTDHIFPLRVLAGHLSDVDAVEFHPNSNYIATGSTDRSCRLWDVTTGECARVFEGHTDAVHALAFSDNGQLLASGADDYLVIMWDIGEGSKIAVCAGHRAPVYSVSFSGDGTLLASGGADNTVRIWAARDAVHDMSMAQADSAAGHMHHRDGRNGDSLELAAFPTKSTSVFMTQFSPRNLLFAGGIFESEGAHPTM